MTVQSVLSRGKSFRVGGKTKIRTVSSKFPLVMLDRLIEPKYKEVNLCWLVHKLELQENFIGLYPSWYTTLGNSPEYSYLVAICFPESYSDE
eukprot:scaffold25035_cov162-Cylindrotheca_fusiformis.AAC.4